MPHSVRTIIGIMIGSHIAVIDQRAPLCQDGVVKSTIANKLNHKLTKFLREKLSSPNKRISTGCSAAFHMCASIAQDSYHPATLPALIQR